MMSNTLPFNAAAAREATRQAQTLDGQYLRKETDDILNTIKTVAQAGKSSTSSTHTNEAIVKRLESLGYAVNHVPSYGQREPAYISISW